MKPGGLEEGPGDLEAAFRKMGMGKAGSVDPGPTRIPYQVSPFQLLLETDATSFHQAFHPSFRVLFMIGRGY